MRKWEKRRMSHAGSERFTAPATINRRVFDSVLLKGRPGLTAYQRIGIAVIGAWILSLGIAGLILLSSAVHEFVPGGVWFGGVVGIVAVFTVSVAFCLLGGRIVRTAVTKGATTAANRTGTIGHHE